MRNKKVYEPIDLGEIQVFSIEQRKGEVAVRDFVDLAEAEAAPHSWPEDLRDVAQVAARAHENDFPVGLAFGPDVIRCGLSPVVIDLMERGVVTIVATDIAGAADDIEIACHGSAGWDVAAEIKQGEFGPVDETSGYMNDAAVLGRHRGLGQAVGDLINEDADEFPHGEQSILAAASRLDCVATVHVAVGTNAVFLHPEMDVANLATASFIDFRKLCSVLADMHEGVWLNGDATEVISDCLLMAYGVARSVGADLEGLTVVNFSDGAERVDQAGGCVRMFSGGCEVMLPLLHRLVLAQLADEAGPE